jgi:hypothetical protein
MLASLKPGADFSRGCAGRRLGNLLFATHPLALDSRIDSERRALAFPIGPGLRTTVETDFRETPSSTLVYKPAAGHYNSGKCFIVIFGYSPSVKGVGS